MFFTLWYLHAFVGLFFAGLTLLSSQLSETNRGSRTIALSFLDLTYLLRLIGDVSNKALSMQSSLDWVVRS
ncbi:hypothetical protein ACF3NG_00300 [Aerococcaceae bacterium WGS1372]